MVNKFEELDVNAAIFHLNDSVSKVMVEVKNNNMLYKRNAETMRFDGEVKVSFALSATEDFKHPRDTGSFYMLDGEVEEPIPVKSLTYEVKLNVKLGNTYWLRLETVDLNRKSRVQQIVPVVKVNRNSRQNFLLQSTEGPLYRPYLVKDQRIQIQTANADLQTLHVLCFQTPLKAALPPFSTKEPARPVNPDSTFVITGDKGRFYVMAPVKGFYFITPDPKSNEGFCVFTYDASFPAIHSADEMIQTCRYMMYKEEYDSCMMASDKKLAIDNFWMNIGGSHERAREILKKYYERVMFANQQFSSYMEGWKSDRGMVSIIFGPPTNVFKSAKDEIWVYGIESNPATLRFIFKKNTCPFSDNDYSLERSELYKDAYYQAVDFWRQGIVYNENTADR